MQTDRQTDEQMAGGGGCKFIKYLRDSSKQCLTNKCINTYTRTRARARVQTYVRPQRDISFHQ